MRYKRKGVVCRKLITDDLKETADTSTIAITPLDATINLSLLLLHNGMIDMELLETISPLYCSPLSLYKWMVPIYSRLAPFFSLGKESLPGCLLAIQKTIRIVPPIYWMNQSINQTVHHILNPNKTASNREKICRKWAAAPGLGMRCLASPRSSRPPMYVTTVSHYNSTV